MSDDEQYARNELARAVQMLAGRRIVAVDVECEHDRTDKLLLSLDDGTKVEVEWWASYADDGGLSFDQVTP